MDDVLAVEFQQPSYTLYESNEDATSVCVEIQKLINDSQVISGTINFTVLSNTTQGETCDSITDRSRDGNACFCL